MGKYKDHLFNSQDEHIGFVEKPDGEDVALLQQLLTKLGYLKGGGFDKGDFCNNTRKAVMKYQRFHELSIDGVAGPQTKESLSSPRCGLPEEDQFSSSFVLRGCKYENTNILTYAFENNSEDFSDPEEARHLVREAFGEWQRVCRLNFQEVSVWENPQFRISWEKGQHGDGSAFDGVGRTLAHAFYPPPCGGPHSGKMHFDDAESFANGHAPGRIDLRAVAIHEIGHLLGLRHSDKRSAIMFPTYNPAQLTLGDDDIAGIQDLYGLPQMEFLAVENGHLSGKGKEARFSLMIPEKAKINLDGPEDADFDLYVKKSAEPTTSDYDIRAWTVSSDEEIAIDPVEAARHHILVKSYSGKGDFKLTVKLV